MSLPQIGGRLVASLGYGELRVCVLNAGAHRRPMPQDCPTNCVDSISVYGAAGKGRMRETTDDVGGIGATNMLVESRSMAMTTAGATRCACCSQALRQGDGIQSELTRSAV